MKLLYKLPSRSRPQKLFAAIDNILLMAKHPDFAILVTLDIDDDTVANTPVLKRLYAYPQIDAYCGTSLSKISAVNRDMAFAPNWDIVIATSDDMEFIKPGFDLDIIADMPEHLDAVIHYPDGFPHGDILSLPVMGRKYYERLGYIYNPIYQSLFCDNEALIVAERMGKLIKSDRAIVRHNHPAWGQCAMDAQYRRTEALYAVDKKTFERRTRLNFPIKTNFPI